MRVTAAKNTIRGNCHHLSFLSLSFFFFLLTPKMAPNIYPAKLTLSCPLFAADFDPRNNRFLLVGGGGGQGRSGVGNKIASPFPSFFPTYLTDW